MNSGTVTSAEEFRRRSGLLFLLLCGCGLLAAGHLLYYSWYRRDGLLRESRRLAWREGSLPPIRGRILTTDSKLLAWTELSHDLIVRKPLPAPNRLERMISDVTSCLPVLAPEEKENVLLLVSGISPSDILKLEPLLSAWRELAVVPRMIRRRARLPGLREKLGETAAETGSPALRGISGIERKYDAILAGKPGKFRVMLDRNGNWVSGTIEILVPPENGKDVTLPPESSSARPGNAEEKGETP